MTTKPKLSDMTGYEADDVVIVKRETYDRLLRAIIHAQNEMLRLNASDTQLAPLRAALAKAVGR